VSDLVCLFYSFHFILEVLELIYISTVSMLYESVYTKTSHLEKKPPPFCCVPFPPVKERSLQTLSESGRCDAYSALCRSRHIHHLPI